MPRPVGLTETSAGLASATDARTTRLRRTLTAPLVLRAGQSLTRFNPPCDSLRARRFRVHRIPHPTSVTIAIRPSCGTGWRGLVQMICPTAKAKYFLREDWTAQISLNCLTKIAFWRMGFRDLKSAPARRHEATSRSPDQQPTIFHVCVRGPGGIKTPARCPGVKRRSCAGSAPATW